MEEKPRYWSHLLRGRNPCSIYYSHLASGNRRRFNCTLGLLPSISGLNTQNSICIRKSVDSFVKKQDWIYQYQTCGVFFKSVKQHSHLFNLNLCYLLVAANRPDPSNQPLFNIISISHSVQLFDHLLTFEHRLVASTSCDHEQQACMLATNACIKHQLNVTRSQKSCTKIAEFALVLAVLQQTASKKRPLLHIRNAGRDYCIMGERMVYSNP